MTRLLLAALLMLCTAKAGAVAPVGERQDTATITTEQQPDTVKRKRTHKLGAQLSQQHQQEQETQEVRLQRAARSALQLDTGFGLGIIGMGLYRQDRRDSLSQPSNVSIFGDVTTKSSYTVGIFGTHMFPYGKGRIESKYRPTISRRNSGE